MKAIYFVLFFLCLALASSAFAGTFEFVPGNYYTTDNFTNYLREFDSAGQLVTVRQVPAGQSLCGLAFGPDRNLYVTSIGSTAGRTQVDVLAINSQGVVLQTYHSPDAPFITL